MTETAKLHTANRRIISRLLLVVVAMFGFGFALVPLYNVFCDVTGLNGKTGGRVAIAPMEVDETRTVTVEFLATLNKDLPWEVHPAVAKMQVHPGKPYTTSFFAHNRAGHTMVGQAVPSVTPGQAARHFHKTECFCFTEQQFGPGESRDMPLQFILDPALPDSVHTVTLAYTFFDKAALTASTDGFQALAGNTIH